MSETTPAQLETEALIDSWVLSLHARNLSPLTLRDYPSSARMFARWMAAQGIGARELTAARVRAWLAAEIERTSAATAASHYRHVRVWLRWLAKEEEIPANPAEGIPEPKVSRKLKPPLSDDDLAALLKACAGNGFYERRDAAIIRVLTDTGMRVSGLCGLRYDPGHPDRNDVSLAARMLRITLKGGDEHPVRIGNKTAAALDRYLRARGRHPRAALPWLWVGKRGHLGVVGVEELLRRRAAQAGVTHVYPHRFRRTFASDWLDAGGSAENLMRIAGWKSYTMVGLYTEELAVTRAHEAHDRLARGDRV